MLNKIIEAIKNSSVSERFNKLQKREKIFAVSLLVILFSTIYYKAFFLASKNNLHKLKTSFVSLNSKIAEIRAKIPDVPSAQSELNQAKADFEILQLRLQSIEENLPNQENIPRFLGELVKQGADLKVDFISIKPQALKGAHEYPRLDIEVKVNATYNNFVNYLHRIENISKFLSIVSMGMEEAKEAPRGYIQGRVVLSTLLGSVGKGAGSELALAKTVEGLKLGKSPFASKVQPSGSEAGIVLSGINWMGGNKVAIINNNAYREGETVENMLIKQILPNMVILLDQATNETYTLVLDIERSTNEK